ncbi:nucleoside-diphosphate kinase [Streptococcus dentapri]|uniref:Nucleoside diphosphate kinase n=1 Tax=Streptococcus dentapri TaxID=573564 RepID=A0ABV8CYP1_9STRE
MEETFFILKPDAVERGLVGEILQRAERRGFTISRLEVRKADRAILAAHYEDLADKPFFDGLADFMMSRPLVIGTFSGNDVIKSWRQMLGATNPADSAPGTIRGDFAMAPSGTVMPNIAHGSDSPESAQREIALWFGQA